MPNLFAEEGASSWIPRADAIGAPAGALLRADNLTLDEMGSVTLRAGSELIQSALGDTDEVNNILTAVLTGGTKRFVAAENQLYQDGVSISTFNGTGRIALGKSARWAFAARSNTRKATDGTTVYDWFIPKPNTRPELSTIAASTEVISRCTAAESTPFAATEGTLSFVMGGDGIVITSSSTSTEAVTTATAHGFQTGDVVWIDGHTGSTPALDGAHTVTVTGSTTFTMDDVANITVAGTGGTCSLQAVKILATDRGSATRTFASDQNYSTLGGNEESAEDLVDFKVYSAAPERVKMIQIMFGLGTAADAFQSDYYYFDFDVANYSGSQPASSPAVEARLVDQGHDDVPSPAEVVPLLQKGEADRAVRNAHRLGRPDRLPLVSLPRLAVSASPAWTHLAVMRNQFKRNGSTEGRNWSTVRAVRVVVHMTSGSSQEFRFDSINWFAAGFRAYTGTYRVRVQEVFAATDGRIEVQSPPSEASDPVEAYQQGLQVTISETAIQNRASLTNQFWVYLNGGQLDDWYRVAVLGVDPNNSSMRLDEYTSGGGSGSDLDTAAERSRFISHDFGYPTTPGGDMVADILSSEVDALEQNITLIRGLVEVPVGIIDIAGPFEYRMAVLTSEGYLYFSKRNAHGTFSVYQTRDIGPDPLWLAQTPSGLYVGTKRDVFRVTGDGDENPDGTVNFAARPMHNPHPPVDRGVWVEGNDVIYRSADGLMAMNGDTVTFFPFDDIEPLFRGKTRHGVAPLNTATGDFQFVVDNRSLYFLAPEGVDTTTSDKLYRYSFVTKRWHRYLYPYTISALHREPTGGVLAGTTGGEVYLLDQGTQDNGENIEYELWTRFADASAPAIFKDAYDIQLGIDTGSEDCTVQVFKEDGTTDVEFTANTTGLQVFRNDITSFGSFRLAQVRLIGSSYALALRHFNISFRSRPQHAVALDTGYVQASRGGDLVHIYELELSCLAANNLTVTPYFDGVAGTAQPVTVTAGVNTVYRVPLPRGSFGKRARFLIQSTDAIGADDPGFEMYNVRMWVSPTGNQKGSQPVKVFPLQGADTPQGQEMSA